MTSTTLEDHYQRYDLVLHLESAAVGVAEAYVCYPNAHRRETVAQAAHLDHLLGEVWSQHPSYVKLQGTENIEAKISRAKELIRAEIAECNELRTPRVSSKSSRR